MASRDDDPCHAVKLFILGSKYLMTPLLSVDARYAPEWVNLMAHTAESWACRMVSKLNVRPFQSVNSPLVDPVSMRRDSGVHYILLGRRLQLKDLEKAHKYNIHWTANLVGRGMYKFGTQRC